MDPDENLREQAELSKEIIARIDSKDDDEGYSPAELGDIAGLSGRLAELSAAYCDWIRKDGFVPASSMKDQIAGIICRDLFDGESDYMLQCGECADSIMELAPAADGADHE